jgi:hypothetical protein
MGGNPTKARYARNNVFAAAGEAGGSSFCTSQIARCTAWSVLRSEDGTTGP